MLYLVGIFVEGIEGNLVFEEVIKKEIDFLKVVVYVLFNFVFFFMKMELVGFNIIVSCFVWV